MKHAKSKRAGARTSKSATQPVAVRPGDSIRLKESRNKANTIRNWVKVENYLMEVEKSKGFAKSWELRERLERGQVSLDELMGR